MHMIRKTILFLLSSLLVLSCGDDAKPIPEWPHNVPDKEDDEPVPDPLNVPTGVPPTDMVLIYGGGHHRTPYGWKPATLEEYMVCNTADGKPHWLFDGFLLLEFMDPAVNGGAGVTFITGAKYNGSYMESASKKDWNALIDYWFAEGSGLDAIEKAAENASRKTGLASAKMKIVIGIPEPITFRYSATMGGGTTYWDAGVDFNVEENRIKACKWFIDEVRARFSKGKYSHLELNGFYWVAEKATQSRGILNAIAEYTKSMNYTFNWIPYFNADGFRMWKSFGFSNAYIQPNYFFSEEVPYSRLMDACNIALMEGMGMEIEFDGNALDANGRAYRLRDYLELLKQKGIWEESLLAYYQGAWAFSWLRNSRNEADKKLYDELCNFIITRPIRKEK